MVWSGSSRRCEELLAAGTGRAAPGAAFARPASNRTLARNRARAHRTLGRNRPRRYRTRGRPRLGTHRTGGRFRLPRRLPSLARRCPSLP